MVVFFFLIDFEVDSVSCSERRKKTAIFQQGQFFLLLTGSCCYAQRIRAQQQLLWATIFRKYRR
jgi:hypothetical protein